MRVRVLVSLVALVAGAFAVLSAPVAAQAAEALGIDKFAAVNCSEGHEGCAHETVSVNLGFPLGEQHYSVTKEPTTAEAEAEGYVTAGGHVPYGVTDFKVATEGSLPSEKPTATVKHIRTDVAPGLATSPAAVPMCGNEAFGKEELPGTGLFTAPTCSAATKIGVNQVTVYLEKESVDLALEGFAYNLEQPKGRASNYGVAIKLPIAVTKGELEEGFAAQPLPESDFPGATKADKEAEKKAAEKHFEEEQWYSHTLIEGNVEWGKEAKGTDQGDYHDYFEIEVSTALPLISSRLVFYGRSGEGDFIANATSCPGHNTTILSLTDLADQTVKKEYTTPVGLRECEKVPFFPGFSVAPEPGANDQPDALVTEYTMPQYPKAKELETGQVDTATVTLPEGMTLNPSAAAGLEACTPAQARIHSDEFGVACPGGSAIGTDTLNVPGLPEGSLTGNVYLGGPESGPITGSPYTIYVVANSKRYGVSVRIKGEVTTNETTGQLTTVFRENPEQPFDNLKIEFNRGALTSVANPLACGTPEGSASFQSYSGKSANSAFGVSITGCGSSLPFSLGQSTEGDTSTAGAHTSYVYSLTRNDGEQYLQKIKTTLPEGLVGTIPAVTQCGEPQAAQGTCGAASRIGTATVTAGAGPFPFTFSGPVYLTGKYNGAPFGLSIPINAVAGPFNLGTVVTRATINVNPTSARVTAEAEPTTIVKGVPVRLRSLTVAVTKQGFMVNPTHCSGTSLETESTLTSTSGTLQSGLRSPWTVEGCGSLPFTPKFTASTSGKYAKEGTEAQVKKLGASLVTTITQPAGQANIKSVFVQLPRALPSRLTTLQKACLAKTFEENPLSCKTVSPGSVVGTVRAVTPVLPNVLEGPAILVSHAGEEFPSLELVLEEASGVRVIVEGKTHIHNKITTTFFETAPDVPVSSITVNLPLAENSALAPERLTTNLCTTTLLMPTTITAQNGKAIHQNTVIAPTECPVQIVGRKVVGNTVYLTIRTYAAGRITGSGSGLVTTSRTLSSASKAATLKVPLSSAGLARRRPFSVKIRVVFTPKQKGAKSSSNNVTVTFG